MFAPPYFGFSTSPGHVCDTLSFGRALLAQLFPPPLHTNRSAALERPPFPVLFPTGRRTNVPCDLEAGQEPVALPRGERAPARNGRLRTRNCRFSLRVQQ